MMNAQDIKNGTCIRLDGRLYFCVEFLHVKPGKGNTFMRTKLKDVVDGRVLERRFNIGEKLEDVRVERRPYQYLYADGGDDIFMNQETFDQVPINKELVTGAAFMKEGDIVEVVSDASTNTVLYAEMPMKTVLKITYTEPGIKGDTATPLRQRGRIHRSRHSRRLLRFSRQSLSPLHLQQRCSSL